MVTVDDVHVKKIESIRSDMKCPYGFACCEADFKNLCKVQDGGLAGYLDCLDGRGPRCTFSVSFGYGHLCKCPLRVYLGKKLKI